MSVKRRYKIPRAASIFLAVLFSAMLLGACGEDNRQATIEAAVAASVAAQTGVTPLPTVTAARPGATTGAKPSAAAQGATQQAKKYKVTFNRLNVINATEPLNEAGEVKLAFEVNGQTQKWPASTDYMQLKSGQSVDIAVEFVVSLRPGDTLEIQVTGKEVDVFMDDPMGVVYNTYYGNADYGAGSHEEKSTCDKGCFSLDYEIEPA